MKKMWRENEVQQLEALGETSSPAGKSLRSCALAAVAPTCSSLYISKFMIMQWTCGIAFCNWNHLRAFNVEIRVQRG